MTAMPFDTLKLARQLEASGFDAQQAAAAAEALAEAMAGADLATKADLRAEMAELKTTLIQWAIGVMLAGVGLSVAVLTIGLRVLP